MANWSQYLLVLRKDTVQLVPWGPQGHCKTGGKRGLPVLTRMNHCTARGMKAPPVGAGAVLGRHTHIVLE